MELEKILEKDLEGKGVWGQADVPGLSAEEMQRKVEEIVRDVAIVKINEIIGYVAEKSATKEDLEKLLIESGAVNSVFGRAGNVAAKKGDYTADMVGAAEKLHAENHAAGGNDFISPKSIGAAEKEHGHGNIDREGKIGTENGKVIVTGIGGKLEAKNKTELGFKEKAKFFSTTGKAEFTVEENAEYDYSDITFFKISAAPVCCHGFVTFGFLESAPEVEGFVYSGDNIREAHNMETWEFSVFGHNGIAFAEFRNWGIVLR